MANTTNFNWETPDDTDLVKDGALAIRTLGNAIDTSLVDLKGGTTGQVLSKTSNTDMDFTWVTSDDANAIQNAIVDAKGDLIAASAADTPARLAVGNNGESLVADSSATTGLRWQGNYAAGKNKIINGDFFINQRGLTSTTTSSDFLADRWRTIYSGGTTTSTVENFTLGAAPVAGYEGKSFWRMVTTSQSSATDFVRLQYNVESVRTFAGQDTTLSFWAKAASGTPKIAIFVAQSFGTGGSPSSNVDINAGTVTLSTSWVRYSVNISIPSISGKTFGTAGNDNLSLRLLVSGGSSVPAAQSIGLQNNTFDIWGVQWEAGNVATAFQTATGNLQGELAACQRYYVRQGGQSLYQRLANGAFQSSTTAYIQFPHPVTMRVAPTSVDFSTMALNDYNSTIAATNITIDFAGGSMTSLAVTVASGGTQYRPVQLLTNNSTSAYVGLSAEL